MMFKRKQNEDSVRLGDYDVKVPKLTPAKWRVLFGAIETIPKSFMQVLAAKPVERMSYALVAFDESMEEICVLIATITDEPRITTEYIKEHVGLDEIIEFITMTAKKNRLSDAVKNVTSLLGK